MTALYNQYRPQTFDDVVGQSAATKALQQTLKRKSARAFLLSGPSGTGKTTLARIAASTVGAKSADAMWELDAAIRTGAEDMRAIIDQIKYRPISGDPRVMIIDECHGLSRQAWDSLLKSIEEPPAWLYWFFCTTNLAKVPKTIVTRCVSLPLKPVSESVLAELLARVIKAERIELADDVDSLIIREANGSPRQLLANLEACIGAPNKKRAAELLKSAAETDAVIELARFIAGKGGSWRAAMAIYSRIPAGAAEGARIVVSAYLGKALQGAGSDDAAAALLGKLDAFSAPYNANADPGSQLLLAIGRALYGE